MLIKTPYGEVTIPFHNGEIAVSCSGGADSTILLYILAQNPYTQPKVYFIDKANSSRPALQACLDFINAKLGTTLVIESHPRTYEGHDIRGEIYTISNKTGYLYTGVTRNPPVSVHDTGIPDRSLNGHKHIITPFDSLDKRVTIWLYEYFEVRDLLELTYTCTESTPPCNNCFACKERTWAIEMVENDLMRN